MTTTEHYGDRLARRRARARLKTEARRKAQRDALYADARAAGFLVYGLDGRWFIERTHKRTGAALQGIVIYPDGTAFDSTVRLDLAKALRSDAAMRRVLGL